MGEVADDIVVTFSSLLLEFLVMNDGGSLSDQAVSHSLDGVGAETGVFVASGWVTTGSVLTCGIGMVGREEESSKVVSGVQTQRSGFPVNSIVVLGGIGKG